ncbi:acyl-CoA dehydrogenase family protein [Neobacillus niacini]|uniref:acyl-CoA dehydrogenase family protein n=1 Tax=Neobacillus niacini TaxID=86668 RepID=UPI0021CB1DF1|nr:acyl-CoA dehydrogenase family protein [Neobacillus niacini]MCM3766263.1 acyl-CoA dehydrogenase family protein [Neobacillus niacini]
MKITQEVESNEVQLLRKSVQEFCKKEVADYYQQWERDGLVPRELWNKLGEQGFLLMEVPEKYGGLGTTYQYSAVIMEEFYRLGFNSIGANISVHGLITAQYILNYGTERQKEYYLPRMATGELVGAVAMTEPNAGSDLQGIKALARYDETRNEYVISGSKTFITNGQHCDFVVVVAKTDQNVKPSRGTTLFIVDVPAAGFERGRNLEKLGLHSCDTSELFFDEVRVGEDAILGKKNEGFRILMSELPRERLTIAVSAIASMEGVLDSTIQYTKERELFGTTLDHFQNTRFVIADLYAKMEVHRAFVNECIKLLTENKLDTVKASMAKLTCSELQGQVIDECLQLYGGYGYMMEYPVARAFVDARVQRIYGGTSEIMKKIISNELFSK